MDSKAQKTQSYWIATTQGPAYPKLDGHRTEVDVAIVGGGISGLSTAILLKQAGLKVAVLERTRVGAGESGHTTAHLTEIVDTRYNLIESRFGQEGASLVARSSRAAIERIAALSESLRINCGFRRVPAYLYAEKLRHVWSCRREVKAAQHAGVKAVWTRDVPLPFSTRGALKVENQARFNPREYLLGLARAIHGGGSFVFEHSPAQDFREGEPCEVLTPHGRVRAKTLVITTNSPNSSPYLLQMKVAAYRTYAVAARLSTPVPPPGLYWDMQDPYHYVREHNGIWIIGGEDHKTGELADTDSSFRKLREYVASHFGSTDITHQWSGQIIEPADGLPYIGLNPLSDHVYVATGYTGNGMTFGTIAGMLLSDLIIGRQNEWEPLYRPSRIKPLSAGTKMVSENVDYPLYMVKDRVEHRDSIPPEHIGAGEAHVTRWNGQPVAVFREPEGKLHSVSAVCTHMGCHVHFNTAEKSWDCPCHGSRFDVDGHVMNGPAMRNLQQVSAGKQASEKAPEKKPA